MNFLEFLRIKIAKFFSLLLIVVGGASFLGEVYDLEGGIWEISVLVYGFFLSIGNFHRTVITVFVANIFIFGVIIYVVADFMEKVSVIREALQIEEEESGPR